jgi:hypothetical protein
VTGSFLNQPVIFMPPVHPRLKQLQRRHLATYGLSEDLFADPALASDTRCAQVLRGYLRAESIGPLPFGRLAAAHSETADAVFRKILRKPDFTWAEHGEALLRRRKPWYCEHEPWPGFWVIGTRLTELAARR